MNENKKTMLLLQGAKANIIEAAINYANEEIGDIKGVVILGDWNVNEEERTKFSRPVIYEKSMASMERIIKGLDIFKPENVYDLSGSPAVTTNDRNEFAKVITSSGITYEGLDFTFTEETKGLPLLRDFILHRSSLTTICILGTGNNVGKTPALNTIGKVLKKYKPVFITMSSEGPLTPEIIKEEKSALYSKDIRELKKKKANITSDDWHIALSTGLPVIDCFRIGEAYRTGVAAFSNIWTATEMAQKLDANLIIYQGSVIARPPVKLNGEIVIISAEQNPDDFGKIERYSIIKADMIIITRCEEPYCNIEKLERLKDFVRSLASTHLIVETVFRPEPVLPEGFDMRGKNILFVTSLRTGNEHIKYMKENYGCNIIKAIYNEDIKSMEELSSKYNFDAILTEFNEKTVEIIEISENKDVIIYENNLVATDNTDLEKAVMEVTGLSFARNT